MSSEKPNLVQQGGRWVRVGMLTVTLVGPIVNTLLAWLHQRSESIEERSDDLQDAAHNAQAVALERLDELSQASRQRAAEQVQVFKRQAQQFRAQARQLRKTLRQEARQRRRLNKMAKQLRSQELLKRGQDLTEELVVQGNKLSQNLLERGSQVTRELARRGSQVTSDLAERSGQLLQPARKRSTFWTVFGFSVGLVAAAVATYLFMRRRMEQQDIEQGQHIELPHQQAFNGTGTSRPAGEIHHVDTSTPSVATLQAVGLDAEEKTEVLTEAPADAAFIGVVSTKHYYPLTAAIDAEDLVYFASEEEAKAQGFTAVG